MEATPLDRGLDESSWTELMRTLEIEKAAHQIESNDIKGKAMSDITLWSNFYSIYSRLKGFSIRNDKIRRYKDHSVRQRRWVCSREGFREKKWNNLVGRKRTPKPVTRIGCKASLTITYLKDTGYWVSTGFIVEHNHDLASPSELYMLRSHRVVPDCMIQQAKSMKMAGIRTMCILDYIAMQCGGRANLPFSKKDFYNKLAQDRQRIDNETDSEGALGYLTCLAMKDENFYCRFNVDEEDRLHTIFWADGTSRTDYKTFGEVMAFDTTYRTNAYNKPLMMMVGVNHHYRTIIFGVALLADETVDTYTWVLNQFVDCMYGERPKVVVTDGDHAMRASITKVLPQTVHRLCAWHLDTNAGSNVPNGEFKIQFNKLMYKFYNPEEFEERWKSVVQELNLQENAWVTSAYEKRHSWAETYLRGNFIGGMRTTQRCEAMNAYMRRFLDSKHLLRDFVSQIDQGIQHIRLTELEDDFKTKHSEPCIPSKDPLALYYRQLATTCTRNIYDIIAKQIEAHNSYTISSSEYSLQMRTFRLSKFRFGEIRHEVNYNPNSNKFNCACLLFETDGIPCRHIFTVMKHLNIEQIPDSLIRKCWRKDAKHCPMPNPIRSSIPNVLEVGRFGTLAAEFNTLATYASRYEDTFEDARKQLAAMKDTFKHICTSRDEDNVQDNNNVKHSREDLKNVIQDPIAVRTKGREREANRARRPEGMLKEPHRKRCRICNEVGHNKATCKQRKHQTSSIHNDPSELQRNNGPTSYSQPSTSKILYQNGTWLTEIPNNDQSSTTQKEPLPIYSNDAGYLLPTKENQHMEIHLEEISAE